MAFFRGKKKKVNQEEISQYHFTDPWLYLFKNAMTGLELVFGVAGDGPMWRERGRGFPKAVNSHNSPNTQKAATVRPASLNIRTYKDKQNRTKTPPKTQTHI